MKIGQHFATRAIALALGALAAASPAAAHDIPDEIVLQSFVRPESQRLQVLLRVPLLAIADANLPKDGPGYLAMAHLDPALREAAAQIASGIIFLEGEEQLRQWELLQARISLPSDRSFDSYETAVAVVRGQRLPDSTLIYYNQGFLDLELAYPIRSQAAAFSMRVLFGRGLANRTATVINFVRPDGQLRTFRVHDDTPLVRLDPKPHQVASVFLSAGFYRLVEGLDHLVFLVALVLPYRRARDLVPVVAAFAAAHALALMISRAVALPFDPWLIASVGAGVGASVVYLSLANGLGTSLRPRVWLAAGFGLLHGLAFSFALEETLQFAGAHHGVALASYTLGIDAATALVLAIAVPLFNAVAVTAAAERAGVIAVSLIAGHMGWHWMTERFQVAQLSGWPVLDVPLLLVIVRWLLAVTIFGGAIWFVAGLLRKKPAGDTLAEKSIVDGR